MSKNSSKQNLNQLIEWLAANKNVKKVYKEGGKVKFNAPHFNRRRK
jgi:hypothetical protein